jgi:hemolysin III
MATLDFDRQSRSLPLCENRPDDEFANFVTHGLGFLLSVAAAVWLMVHLIGEGRIAYVIACGVYCFTLTGLYAASTLSHAFHEPSRRRFFRMLDQAFIFLLIAGSFTPFGVVVYSRGWWPLLFAAMWVLALLGVAIVLWKRDLTPKTQIIYGVLGWLPVISLPTLFRALPSELMGWIIAGGLAYTAGTLFLIFDNRVRYFHAMWHTSVIAGTTCHYIAILMLSSLA